MQKVSTASNGLFGVPVDDLLGKLWIVEKVGCDGFAAHEARHAACLADKGVGLLDREPSGELAKDLLLFDADFFVTDAGEADLEVARQEFEHVISADAVTPIRREGDAVG